MPRPDHFGTTIEIDSLESADKALHELGWLKSEQARLAAWCKQKIEELKEQLEQKCTFAVGREETTFSKRIELLEESLAAWTLENITPLLTGKKRTKVLAHGEIGLRQSPLTVELGQDEGGATYKEAAVLEWIREAELKPSQREALTETKTTLHLKGAKDALDARKITREQLEAIGLIVRDEHDEAVVKPAKIAVTAE